MIAVDTNVLLRYLLRDDTTQAQEARQLFECGERVLITDVVLAEAVWTLLGRRYRAAKTDVIAFVGRLLQEPNVRFEYDEVIFNALQAYRETEADFADALIVHKALKVAPVDDGLHTVYTFDANALQLPHTAAPQASPKSR